MKVVAHPAVKRGTYFIRREGSEENLAFAYTEEAAKLIVDAVNAAENTEETS